jgi:hypothetical protein
MIKILHNLALFRVKNANFFGENIFKITTSVPDWAKFRHLGDILALGEISTFGRNFWRWPNLRHLGIFGIWRNFLLLCKYRPLTYVYVILMFGH